MNKKSPKATSWGGVADWYDSVVRDDGSYQKNVVLPNLLRIVDPKEGMTVFDTACGQGYFSRAFAEAGARVMASDISEELVEIAKQEEVARERGGTIEYHVAAADDLSFAEDASADVVTIVLALQNIENLSGTVAEASRVLKPSGRLVFILNHPAFRIPKRSGWGEEAGKKQEEGSKRGAVGLSMGAGRKIYRRIDVYMSDFRTEIDMTPGEVDPKRKKTTVSFHRPLQSYFKALSKSGLAVTRFEEWISYKKSQPGPFAAEEDRIRKEIPMFLCVEARKISV